MGFLDFKVCGGRLSYVNVVATPRNPSLTDRARR